MTILFYSICVVLGWLGGGFAFEKEWDSLALTLIIWIIQFLLFTEVLLKG